MPPDEATVPAADPIHADAVAPEAAPPAEVAATVAAEVSAALTAEVTATQAKDHAAIAATIEQWHTDHFNSVPIGWGTDVTNYVRAAKDDLKKRLTA